MKNKHKNIIKHRFKHPVRKKLCSIVVAGAMFATSMPNILYEGFSGISLTAFAKNEDNYQDDQKPSEDKKFDVIGSPSELAEYSKYYHYYASAHQNDTITIQYGQGETNSTISDFIAIGTSEYPFAGTITVVSSTGDSDIKIPEAFFNYVSDKAKINGTLILQRSTKASSEPVFARYITHDSSTQTANTWSVQLNEYVDEWQTISDNYYSGFIGEMQNGTIADINITDNNGANISGIDDIGYVCGKMGRNTRLTVAMSGSNTGYSVSTSFGNVGGIVGSMDDKSVLTLNSAPLNTDAAISTGSGYAGGIVGYNDGGIVKFGSGITTYGGTITGTTAAGGLFGYYRPLFDDPTTTDNVETNAGDINVANLAVNATVKSSENVGGLFGELMNKSVTVTDTVISETGEVTTPESRTDGAGGTINISGESITCTLNGSTNIGGIAGKYEPFSLADTLEINGVSTSITNSGSYDNYGGAIGLVNTTAHDGQIEAAYVKFTTFTLLNAASCGTKDKYFGGLIGKGEKAYIDASDITVTATNFKGGGIVGNLGNGVLKLGGIINLTNAAPSETDIVSTQEGQIVGYRDNALIYSDAATISLSDRKVDNVGAWGDVLVFDGSKLTKASVLTENSGHTITMAALSSSVVTKNDFAKQALAMQIAYSSNNIITNYNVTAPTTLTIGTPSAGQTAAAPVTIDLTGTGLKGLTRDNSVGTSDTKYQSLITSITGVTNSTTRSCIKLDVKNVGGKPIYRHAYNGLIGESKASLTIENLDFDGTMELEPCVTMYAGMAAAKSAAITATTCNVLSTAEFYDYYHEAGNNKWGSSELYLGRLVGTASGAVTISGGTYDGKIGDPSVTTNAWASSANNCYGGIVGKINSGASSFTDVTVSGTIKNGRSKKTQKLGGLVAEIARSGGAVTLSNVTTNGLTVSGNATDSCGGLLGYGWYNSNVTIGDSSTIGVNVGISTTNNNVTTVTGHSTVNSNDGATAGLVYCATGKWTVNKLAINGLNVSSTPASFGMIVNKGWDKGSDGNSPKQAIYMVLPNNYSYTINSTEVTLPSSISVFDELVAYSAEVGKVTENGQGVVSIHTSGGVLTMGGSAANTYTAKTSLGKNNPNPNTRYYYNLDTIAKSSANSITGANAAQEKLMNWGLYQYACSNIQNNFCNPFNGTIDTAIYDMTGYSWYPVDVTSNIEVNGTFKFYNTEIETGIGAKDDTKYLTLTPSQHYLMQNALFNNVSKKLTVGSITLQGNVGVTDNGSGALVYGIVKGSSSSDNDTAEVKVTGADGIVLDGIHVHDLTANTEYAPLLINKSGEFSTLTIKGVKVDSLNSYKNSVDTSIFKISGAPKIATSLIGNCGESASSLNVSVSFSDIQLDGRKHEILTGNTALDEKYYTSESLFTKATLLNELIYSTGGGTYEFDYSDDWTPTPNSNPVTYTHDPVKVTYGSEISDNSERKEYFGKEFWYKNGQSSSNDITSGTYIHPVGLDGTGWNNNTTSLTGNAGYTNTNGVISWTAPYDFSGFLPYVYTKYSGATGDDGISGVSGAHQLKINHVSATFSGCGTYNDPYIITSGDDFKKIESIINGDYNDIALSSIYLPTKTVSGNISFDSDATWCSQDASYTITHTANDVTAQQGADTVAGTALRTYLAGAYYKISEGSTITIEDDSTHSFTGLGNISNSTDTFAVFRGVIVGTGTERIINKTNYPLIASSYGSVVRGLKIEVNAEISKSNNTATTPFKADSSSGSGCEYYGAVIGQIFGGDNIIDNVYVDYTNATVTISGNNAHVIPVGGYVGVLLNGGLYFRNMNNGNVSGLPNDKTYKGSVGVNSESLIYTYKKVNNQRTFTTDPNMKYLYVNPIIGRVMNGFAITETDKFRPFEDGSREYPDGSHVYFNGTNFVEKAAGEEYIGTKVGVTLKNGTKNYSITDIDKTKNAENSAIFTMKDSNGNTSGANGATITVSDAQQLFLISCITQAGLGQSSSGQYFDEKQYYKFVNANNLHSNFFIQSYADYMSTHHGDYNEIGNTSSTDYTQSVANNDTHSGGIDTIPHIIKKYSPAIDSTHYAAFNITNSDNSRFYYMTLAKSNNNNTQTFYLPDGYRGIGCMLFTTTDDSVLDQREKSKSNIEKIQNDYYYMYLAGFEGNENIVSLNMSYYSYGSSNDNYSTPKSGNNSTLDLGFGFFNGIRCKYNSKNEATKIKNIHIKGSVDFDIKTKDTGVSDSYNIDENAAGLLSTGGFTGAVGSDDKNTYYFENISLDKISISGCKFTGGMVGCINLGSGGSGEFHTKNCSADEITVFGGHYAGGMVGLVRNAAAKFVAEFDTDKSFIIKSISSGSDNFGAGGVIGCNRSNTTCNVTNLCIDGAIVRDDSGNAVMYEGTNTPKRLGYIGNSNKNNYSGGIIGYTRRSPQVTLSNCEVKNIVVRGRRTGGAIGYLGNDETDGTPTANISSFKLTAENSDSKLLSSFNDDNAGNGGVIGYTKSNSTTNIVITDSIIDGYTIEAPKNVGGIIGKKTNTKQAIVAKNISVTGVTIKNTTNSGGLIGHLYDGSLLGYNILTNNITFEKYASSNMSNCGQIVGNNNSKVIQIVGFSRQGTGIQAEMVGNYAANATTQYGTNGYVVFSDYKGTALLNDKNQAFSTIKNVTNVNPASPYVNVNPKRIVDTSGKFLTGDGIYNSSNTPTYAGSMINTVISDIQGGSKMNRYQSTGLSDDYLTAMSTNLNAIKKYSTYITARGGSSLSNETLKNMPVLILDDSNPANTTAMVNNYLKLLTNTSFNFAAGDSAFTVGIAKCTYDSNGVLTATYNGANLLNDTQNGQFKLSGTSYDNSDNNVEQFTLIDVAFKDPSDASKVAYHLYVPVFIKKMLYFDFYAGTISGTTYLIPSYEAVYGNSIVENTGNPITMQFRWIYKRELGDWVNYISSGEDMLWNYDKVLDVSDKLSNGLPDNTKMVLVDANNNNHAFYGTTSTTGLLTINNNKLTAINLNRFEASDSTNESPNPFEPIDFNDFFDITTTQPTDWTENGDSGYYMTTNTFVVDNDNGTVKVGSQKYKLGTGTGAVYLYVKFKDGMTYTTTDQKVYLKEDYYITFITPKFPNDPLRHLEIGSAMKMPDDTLNPTSRSGQNPTHFYIGDIFDNDFKIKATNSVTVMDEIENPTLKATMEAKIGVKPAAGAKLGDVLKMNSVNIYQSFLMTLNTSYYDENNVLQSVKGFAVNSNPNVTVKSFTIAGESVDDLAAEDGANTQIKTLAQMSGDNANIDANFLELRNCVDLSRKLFEQYNAYATAADPTEVNTKIEIKADVELKYSTGTQIEAQFPTNSNPQSTEGQRIGTSIEGNSNISTKPDSAKYSKTSEYDEDGDSSAIPEEPIYKYYRKAIKKAKLNYYSADTETIVVTPAQGEIPATTEEQLLIKNKYDQFGINAVDPPRETIEDSRIALKTRADYIITDMNAESKSSISKIKVTLKMYTKADNYANNNPLTILDYIDTSTLTLSRDPSATNNYSYDSDTLNAKAYEYTANITAADFTNDTLIIPINFSVYTGKNNNFEGANKQYSNYMVHLDVALYDSKNVLISGSDVDSHIIYTNAKVCCEIVTPPTS